jgi:hypothetical protein
MSVREIQEKAKRIPKLQDEYEIRKRERCKREGSENPKKRIYVENIYRKEAKRTKRCKSLL